MRTRPTRLLAPLALPLLAFLPLAAGGACATGVQLATGGAGGASSSTGEGGSAPDGGSDALSGPCTAAADCVAFNDQCNAGTCVNGTCVKAPANELAPCDDGLFCTENDACMSGVCTGGTAKYCQPPDACHIGACDEASDQCTSMPGNDGAQCDDMDACTLAGSCLNGQCTKGPPVDCSVFDGPCAVGTCIAGQGCIPMPVNDGTGCNDGLFCTVNDKCTAGMCKGDPNPCAPPNNSCQTGLCDELSKSCTVTVAPNGTPCDDGSICTTNEKCQNGQCTNGQPANNGAACDDKNGCTMGTSCQNGVCGNPQSQINMCISGDSCCPANCNFAQDTDCLYWASGVQTNVPDSALVGWTKCFSGDYSQYTPDLQTLLNQCNKAKLLMACRPVGSPNWTLLAMGPRLDVTFDCGTQTNCTKQSNGVGFYYSTDWSWGFAPGGEAVNRNSCDYKDFANPLPDQDLRMCWHTGGGTLNEGYRCGDNDLNGDSTWERAMFHAD